MNPTKNVLLTVASMGILCAASLGTAQTLQKIEVIDGGLTTAVVRDPDVGISIVESAIPELSFESSMEIIKVEHDRRGVAIVAGGVAAVMLTESSHPSEESGAIPPPLSYA